MTLTLHSDGSPLLCEGNAQVHVFSVREAAEKCGMSEEL
jgi:hypothetical protein